MGELIEVLILILVWAGVIGFVGLAFKYAIPEDP